MDAFSFPRAMSSMKAASGFRQILIPNTAGLDWMT
jgi:hypothetical protein